MLTSMMAMVLTSALASDLSPKELVDRLSSPDRVVREEAARTLEELGAEVLPTLRGILDQSGQPEVRERLPDLMARIEARSLDRPTMVVLDFEDRPLGEAIEAVAARGGFSISLEDPGLAARRVTVKAPGPLPFWEAVDRLGRAGHVRHDPGYQYDNEGRVTRASTIRLVDGDPPRFTAYPGPLRIHAFATHRHRDVSFETPGPHIVPQKSPTMTVEIQAFAEPGRTINPDGQPRLEAVDGQGRSIARQPGGGEQTNPSEHTWLAPGRTSLLHWQVPIGLPDLPARSPLKLRGVLPVVIGSRRPDPLVIPLADAPGKTFRQGTGVVRVERVANQSGSSTVDLTLGEEARPPDRVRAAAGPEEDSLADFPRDRIEFEDAEGHPLGFQIAGNPSASTTNGELRADIFVSGVAPPARLTVYRLQRLAVEIPFELADVPSP